MISHKLCLLTKCYCSLNTNLKQNVFSITALDTFEAMGKRLKARRVQDDMDVLYSYLPLDAVDDVDPADRDDVLKEALTISAKEGKEKMDKVTKISFAYFVLKISFLWLPFNVSKYGFPNLGCGTICFETRAKQWTTRRGSR